MTVYNQEKYLARALDYLLEQQNQQFKLLIIDDGSSDSTVEIAESYRDRFGSFDLVSKDNEGVAAARNLGLDLVDTPYFIFHDGDDWVDPGYTDYFIKAFDRHPDDDMVTCGYYVDQAGKPSVPISKPGEGELTRFQAVLKVLGTAHSPVKGYTWNKCYKTQLVRRLHLRFDEELDLMEDQVFNINYLMQTEGCYYSALPLYHYWQRADSAVHTVSWDHFCSIVAANVSIYGSIFKHLRRRLTSR
ncbi:glycosyltransferase family 2 protein, partial [Lactobacillus nasalidis]|uniref:glycosyltransferase family 2 protein n=3 Tax=Lactobacillus nasalidis TaxID=2797258 RepID=UPI0019163495